MLPVPVREAKGFRLPGQPHARLGVREQPPQAGVFLHRVVYRIPEESEERKETT